MNLSIINRSRSDVSKSFIKSWVMKLAKQVPEIKKYSELTLVFVSSSEMKKMNAKYRGKDYATDVLSFEPIDFGSFAVQTSSGVGRATGTTAKSKRPLGELVFCLSVIKRQAKVHGLTFEQEFGYMIIHGILHLLGYEHESGGAKAKKMFRLQDQTFAKLIKARRG